MKRTFDRLREKTQTFSLPTLGRETEIEVFVIHNSRDPEDYFFIFDFEEFVSRSREGFFVRPKLKLWAGRHDFDRRLFARQFRAAFAREFDAARAQLIEEKASKLGWFGWSLGKEMAGATVSGFTANVVLALATSAGRALWSVIPKPSMLRPKSTERQLEDRILQTKDKVEEALAGLSVTLHPELHAHAWQGGPRGPIAGMDRDAWPLAEGIRQQLRWDHLDE